MSITMSDIINSGNQIDPSNNLWNAFKSRATGQIGSKIKELFGGDSSAAQVGQSSGFDSEAITKYLGDLIKTDQASAREVNAFNAREAQKARDFSERMASTQYQRAVEDLRSAGLNPILAYSNGGAAVPAAASASGVKAEGVRGNDVVKSLIDVLKVYTGFATDLIDAMIPF